MPKSPAGDVVQKACKDFPEAGTRTLASKLWNDPQTRILFKSYENCRSLLRAYRGESGGQMRQNFKGALVPSTKQERCLPPSLYRPIEPYIFKQAGAGAILNDLHVPYHDSRAIDIALDYCIERKHTDFVILNGDVCDIHTLSKFQKDPREKDFPGELEAIEDMLDVLQQTFGRVYFKFGNHENRFQSFMWAKAPELVGVSEFRLNVLLHLEERGIEFIDDNRVIQLAGVDCVHGHEFGKGVFNPVNAARGLFLRAKASAICAHHHSTSEHTEQNIRGKCIATWSIGCLCGLQPQYAPMAYTRWNHGLGLIGFDGKKDYTVENRRIVEGKVR